VKSSSFILPFSTKWQITAFYATPFMLKHTERTVPTAQYNQVHLLLIVFVFQDHEKMKICQSTNIQSYIYTVATT